MIDRTPQFINIPNFYGGINRQDAPNSLPPNQCIDLINHTFGESNMLEVVGGYTPYTTFDATGVAPDGVFRYDDTHDNFLNLAIWNGHMYEDSTAIAGFNFQTQGRCSWAIYNDITYFINAVPGANDLQVAYRKTAWADGKNLRYTGIPAPADGVATAATASAGDLPKGTYRFLFTLELSDGVICEGNPNATYVSATTADAVSGITVSITDPDPTGIYTTLNLYATDCDGTTYYFLDSKALTTGTHTFTWSNYGDLTVSSDNELEYDNYTPPRGAVQAFYNNHLFIGGDNDHPTYLYISKFARYEAFPGNVTGGDPVSSEYIIDCEDRIVEIRVAKNGALLVLCQNSVQAISGYSSTNFARIVLSRSAGCSGAGSVASGSDGMVFWRGWDDFYMSDGANIANIGKYVWPIVKNMSYTECKTARGFFWNHRYYYSYPSGKTYNNYTLEFDTRYPVTNADGVVVCPGAWLGPHTFGVACFTKARKEGEEYAWIGDPAAGIIHRWNSGSDFNGTIIESRCKTGYIYFDAPLITKRFLALGLDVFPTTASPIVNVTFDYNKYTETFGVMALSTGSTTYQTAGSESGNNDDKYTGRVAPGTYGTATYAARFFSTSKHRFSQRGQGDCAQIEIYSKNCSAAGVADRSFAIRNLEVSFSAIRRYRG